MRFGETMRFSDTPSEKEASAVSDTSESEAVDIAHVVKESFTTEKVEHVLSAAEQHFDERVEERGGRVAELAKKTLSTIARHAKLYIPLALLAFSAQPHTEHGYGTFSDKEDAKKELSEKGITKDQRQGYLPVVAEVLFEGVTPLGYEENEKAKEFIPNLVHGRDRGYLDDSRYLDSSGREDAWAMYLGMPQEHGTFGISDYKPSRGRDDKFYYKIPGFFEKFADAFSRHSNNAAEEAADAQDRAIGKVTRHNIDLGPPMPSLIKRIASSAEPIRDWSDVASGVMGHFTMGHGEDENGSYIYYYDNWDLGGSSVEGEEGMLGKPFEIYDRLYYDSETFEPIESGS